MPHLDMEVDVITTRSCRIELKREDFVDLLRNAGFDIADDAEVNFDVPGGGDYSNMRLDVDEDNPVTVRWRNVIHGES